MTPPVKKLIKRVVRGIKWLDNNENIPENWRDLVRQDVQFDMGDCNHCIIGNVYGQYWNTSLSELGINNEESVKLGFQSECLIKGFGDMNEEYSLLSEIWRFYLMYDE